MSESFPQLDAYPAAFLLLQDYYADLPEVEVDTQQLYPWHPDDPVADWIETVRRQDMLTSKDELFALAQQMENGDVDAYHHMITGNLPWVVNRSKPFAQNDPEQYLDTLGAGNLAMAEAAKRYDWTTGNTLTNYSTWILFKRMREVSLMFNSPVHVPLDTQTDFFAARRQAEAQAAHAPGSTMPTSLLDTEAEETVMDAETMFDIEMALYPTSWEYLMDLESSDTDQPNLSYLLPTAQPRSPEEDPQYMELHESMQQFLDQLPPDQKTVLSLNFAIGCEYMSQQAIARLLHIGNSKVSELVRTGLQTLRAYASAHDMTLGDFLS